MHRASARELSLHSNIAQRFGLVNHDVRQLGAHFRQPRREPGKRDDQLQHLRQNKVLARRKPHLEDYRHQGLQGVESLEVLWGILPVSSGKGKLPPTVHRGSRPGILRHLAEPKRPSIVPLGPSKRPV